MSHIKRSALVHYSPAEMYQLVNNVAEYASFLPWCRSSKVISETETEMVASVEIAKGVLNKTFTTHNRLYPNQRIELQLVDGPFKTLSGYWQFDALKMDDACKINFELDFEFDSAMLSIAAKPVFTAIANSLIESFCKRAVQIYGVRS